MYGKFRIALHCNACESTEIMGNNDVHLDSGQRKWKPQIIARNSREFMIILRQNSGFLRCDLAL